MTKIAMITPKIVDITGNTATKKFVGKIVSRKQTSMGTVYAIGNTGYVLSVPEFKMFYEAGAINQVNVSAKAKEKEHAHKSKHVKTTAARTSDALEAYDDISPLDRKTGTRKKSAVANKAESELDEVSKKLRMKDKKLAEHSSYTFGAKHDELLDTSEFLLNYPKPEFKMDVPKHVPGGKATGKEGGVFDKIGRFFRDKAVESLRES